MPTSPPLPCTRLAPFNFAVQSKCGTLQRSGTLQRCGASQCPDASQHPDASQRSGAWRGQWRGRLGALSGQWRRCLGAVFALLAAACWVPAAQAGGGPLGIDSRPAYDNAGIWKRNYQEILLYGSMTTVAAGALWEGGESRLGKTFWQSVDAAALSAIASTALKYAFSRERPSQTADPNEWFTGNGQSFPSGEVTTVSALVTPFVLEYGKDDPAVYALAALPLYDAVARVKTWGHWQTDVIAGLGLGFAGGYFMHGRQSPFVLSLMPHGIQVGFKMRF